MEERYEENSKDIYTDWTTLGKRILARKYADSGVRKKAEEVHMNGPNKSVCKRNKERYAKRITERNKMGHKRGKERMPKKGCMEGNESVLLGRGPKGYIHRRRSQGLYARGLSGCIIES